MKNSRKMDEIRDLKRVTQIALDAYLDRAWDDDRDGKPRFDPATLAEVRRLLREITDSDLYAQLSHLLRTATDHREDIERGVTVWIDLIETLVQTAERRYKAQGRGALKKGEVKSVVLYLVRTQRFNLPNVPDFLEPLVIDVAVDWSVDVICDIANDYGIFVSVERKRSLRGVVLWPLYVVWRATKPFWKWLGGIAVRVWLALRYRRPLSPTLRAALAEVERSGLIAQQQPFVAELIAVKTDIVRNSAGLRAFFQLVCLVVEQAEKFENYSGPEKKAYARDLALAVLSELGERPGWFTSTAVEVIVSIAIDTVVRLFNKWGVFEPRSRRGPSEGQVGEHGPGRAAAAATPT